MTASQEELRSSSMALNSAIAEFTPASPAQLEWRLPSHTVGQPDVFHVQAWASIRPGGMHSSICSFVAYCCPVAGAACSNQGVEHGVKAQLHWHELRGRCWNPRLLLENLALSAAEAFFFCFFLALGARTCLWAAGIAKSEFAASRTANEVSGMATMAKNNCERKYNE